MAVVAFTLVGLFIIRLAHAAHTHTYLLMLTKGSSFQALHFAILAVCHKTGERSILTNQNLMLIKGFCEYLITMNLIKLSTI